MDTCIAPFRLEHNCPSHIRLSRLLPLGQSGNPHDPKYYYCAEIGNEIYRTQVAKAMAKRLKVDLDWMKEQYKAKTPTVKGCRIWRLVE